MRVSWHHLALLAALPAVVVAVTPSTFTFHDALSDLFQALDAKQTVFCHRCVKPCPVGARKRYTNEENDCVQVCSTGLQDVIIDEIARQQNHVLPRLLQDSVRLLPVGEQAEARGKRAEALEQAVRAVRDANRSPRKCELADGATPPLNAYGGPKKGSRRAPNDATVVPVKRSRRPQRGQISPPSASDGYARERAPL
ncbi:MAG: hypothetical protein M1826_005212 [Phylliscum demangeonii]|nr:MAG: hypothetical protein M1826_005212 [Phylliscum demangeonii]